jgi:hypothetical protein
MPFNQLEQEIIILRAAWDMIDGLVNYENFGRGHRVVEAELRFNTATHHRLFNILLADFLSTPPKGIFDLPEAVGPAQTDHTYLFYLKRVCSDPKLNSDSSSINAPTVALADWLEDECFVEKVWFPSIEVETDIRVSRISFLKICGDIAKHNFARLGVNVRRITRILAENGITIDEGQGFLVLPEFYEWFHTNIGNYHGSTLAELLNNIRWGVFEYLRPEFDRSFEKTEPSSYNYRFRYPLGCNESLARTMYWDLMNKVRAAPYVPRFTTTAVLKQRY